jgi:hypothetical protein
MLTKNNKNCLLDVLNYIANNIYKLRLADLAYINNIISGTLSYNEKLSLSDFCFDMVSKIKKDKRNIIEFFS